MKMRQCVVQRIYQLCDENHLTINGLARLSGIHPSTIKSIIYGSSKNPGVTTIKMICDGLNITLMDFFNTPEFLNLEQEIE